MFALKDPVAPMTHRSIGFRGSPRSPSKLLRQRRENTFFMHSRCHPETHATGLQSVCATTASTPVTKSVKRSVEHCIDTGTLLSSEPTEFSICVQYASLKHARTSAATMWHRRAAIVETAYPLLTTPLPRTDVQRRDSLVNLNGRWHRTDFDQRLPFWH